MPFKKDAKRPLANQANTSLRNSPTKSIKENAENSDRATRNASPKKENGILPKVEEVTVEIFPLPVIKSTPKDYLNLIRYYRKIYDLSSTHNSKSTFEITSLLTTKTFLRRTHLLSQLRHLHHSEVTFERFAAILQQQYFYRESGPKTEGVKRQRLEDGIVKLKKRTAKEFEYNNLEVSVPGYAVKEELSGDYITFGFFDVKAPALHGYDSVQFDVFMVLLSEDKQIIFTERLSSFICNVSQDQSQSGAPGTESCVQEYWIPKGLREYGELHVLIRGSMRVRSKHDAPILKNRVKASKDLPHTPPLQPAKSSKLGNLSLKSLPTGSVSTAPSTVSSTPTSSTVSTASTSKENVASPRKAGRPRKSETNEKTAGSSAGSSKKSSSIQSGKAMKKKNEKKDWHKDYLATPELNKTTKRRQKSATLESLELPSPKKARRSASKHENVEQIMESKEDSSEIVLYGTKLVANWKNGDEPPKQLRIHFGKTAVHLVNSNELHITGKTDAIDWKPSDPELISKITEKQRARGQYDKPKIVIELSNEHGIGVESSESEPATPKKSIMKQPRTWMKGSPGNVKQNPAVMYEFIDFIDDLNNENAIRTNSKDSTPSSDHSASATTSTSSGYGSYTSALSENSGTPSSQMSGKRAKLVKHSPSKDPKLSGLMDQLDAEVNRCARKEGGQNLCCLVCSRIFPSIQTLMLHLELSYPAFHFQKNPTKENVIEISFRNAYQTQVSSKIVKTFHHDYVTVSTSLLFKEQVRTIRHFYLTGKLTPDGAVVLHKKPPKELEVNEENVPKLPAGVKYFPILPYTQPIYTELKNPPLPNLCGVEPDQNWMKDSIVRRISEYVDVSLKEKEFFVLWNTFIAKRTNRIYGGTLIKRNLENFAKEHMEDVVERDLVEQWVLHLVNFARNSMISHEDSVYLASLASEPMQFKKKLDLKKSTSPRKSLMSPRKKSLRPASRSPTKSPKKDGKLAGKRSSPSHSRSLSDPKTSD